MNAERPHILVVDDDARLRDLLRRYLGENGFLVTVAGDAAEARRHLAALAFDLIVLDVMMPGESGFDLTQSLRRESSVPILLLTAMGEADMRITGLERGADDYMTKPFEPRELVLRIHSILRRVPREPVAPPPRELRFGAHIYDRERRELRKDGEPVHLTTAEATLLHLLAEAQGEVFSRDDLAARTGLSANPRTVDVQVTRLRKKIDDDAKTPRYLQTVRGAGYVLKPD